MKRFISFILCFVVFTVLSIHNPVMAFWGSMHMAMWDHSQMQVQGKKHYEENSNKSENICRIDNEFSALNAWDFSFQIDKKIFNKFKSSFTEFIFVKPQIHEWSLIWNISPPIIDTSIKKYNYISLIWIIKSNT